MCLESIYSLWNDGGEIRVSLFGDIEDPREEIHFLGVLEEFCRQLLLLRFYISCAYKAQEILLNNLVV